MVRGLGASPYCQILSSLWARNVYRLRSEVGVTKRHSWSASFGRNLPDRLHRISTKEGVGRDEEEAVLEGLADEHPIERVFVMERGLGQMGHRPLAQRQTRYTVTFPLLRDIG